MKKQEQEDIAYKKIVWTIRNFSTLRTNRRHLSKVFTIGDWAWRVSVYRGRKDRKYLALYLHVADPSSLPQGWRIYAEFSFTVVNQFSRENSVERDGNQFFVANASGWGFGSFMELTTLKDPSRGYILDDKCIVEIEIFSIRSEGIELASHPPESKQVPTDLDKDEDDVVEFKDLGEIEKSFVPHLEEVCSWHPSLMECKKNRSRRFTEWAFTALGQVLLFLKNKKWKDMNEEACEKLQYLWEELEISRLELSWLEPLVKSATNMRGYKEKEEKVKRLKENLVVLETEMKVLKEKLADTEQNAEMIRKDLIRAEEVFEEKDLDEKIG